MKRLGSAIIGLALVFTSSISSAWGVLGHHTSAQVALDILEKQNSPALKKIKAILENDDFVEASTWADELRGDTKEDWTHTLKYHFENIEDTDTYISYLQTDGKQYQEKGGAISAVVMSDMILRSNSSSASAKKYALKFLIHFVADIHQPFHTGRAEDNGGNKIDVNWMGFKMNLHQVWDTQIIALGHKDILKNNSREVQIKDYAAYLMKKFVAMNLKNEPNLKYDDWLEESLVFRPEAYQYKNEDAQKYTKRFLDRVDARVYLSGVRMAYTLNRIFAPNSDFEYNQSQTLVDKLKQDIERIVGQVQDIITLGPK